MPKKKTERALVGAQAELARIEAAHAAMLGPNVTQADRDEYQTVLARYPDLSKDYGDLPRLHRARQTACYANQAPVVQESIKHRTAILRRELAGPNPTPLELLLVDAVLACHHDYWTFSLRAEQRASEGTTLADTAKWERVLSSKEGRYLRAIGELARVRRLLNLPAPQLNINMPGGQQVNVAGNVQARPAEAPRTVPD